MKVFLTAGEPSGDALGAALIAGLKSLAPSVTFRGVAGPRMQAAGMESLFAMEELSVMGITEVLPKYFALKRRIAQTAAAALDWSPDLVVTIDSPDFALRVARLIKDARPTLPVSHYVAPTVWAWRPKRAPRMARVIDHVLALFPFEPPYMERAGMACDFVGHPLAAKPPVTNAARLRFLERLGADARPLLAILPGSRLGEIERLLPVFCAAVQDPDLAEFQVVLPTLPHLVTRVRDISEAHMPRQPLILTGEGKGAEDAAEERRVALSAASLALAASGTISLELAAARTPMVIAYDMSWLTRQIIDRKLLIDTVTLVNLVSETRAVPEFIGANCRPAKIAAALRDVAARPEAQLAAMEKTMARLGEGGEAPGLRAARALLARLER
ncbi:MAG: lipid-A-disaccharide synthase [Pseudomonadota bacterium]